VEPHPINLLVLYFILNVFPQVTSPKSFSFRRREVDKGQRDLAEGLVQMRDGSETFPNIVRVKA
jgi:hypothetical protein